MLPAGFLLNVPTAPPAVRLVHYRVQRGDTLAGIAERFDVTVEELKRWNHIAGDQAPRGASCGSTQAAGGRQALLPREGRSGTKAAAGAAAVRGVSQKDSAAASHVVKPGETLYSIARDYRTTVARPRQSNPFLARPPLQAGDMLTVER